MRKFTNKSILIAFMIGAMIFGANLLGYAKQKQTAKSRKDVEVIRHDAEKQILT